jgi:hypothetical protein
VSFLTDKTERVKPEKGYCAKVLDFDDFRKNLWPVGSMKAVYITQKHAGTVGEGCSKHLVSQLREVTWLCRVIRAKSR